MKFLVLLALLVSCKPFVYEFVGSPIAYQSHNSGCEIRFVLRAIDRDTQNRVTKTKWLRNDKDCDFFREVIKNKYGTFYYIKITSTKFTNDEQVEIEELK